ncbi:MAG: hypothetical protein GY714_32565 [Desulfobacterales bacterium]|nr:hypothetical protein [Desulfobacterales bacterium]MCP4160096.1 hypothetical protein [Deltaproteobacteria bacterium]
MNKIKKQKAELIKMAMKKNPGSELIPCGKRSTLDECFTVFENKILFWFNTTNSSSTQMIYSKM